MQEKFKYLNQKDRKTILLLSDDIRTHSGVGTMSREIVINTAHHFNWVNLGGAINPPDLDKIFDLSAEVNKYAGIEDSKVKVIPSNGYGSPEVIRQLIKHEKPDAIMIFTDPRYWIWLFEIEREIRTKIPIFYLNIWDDFPAPMYNKPYYESVDLLMAISKQTKLINELVLEEAAKDKIITYVPHGINSKQYYPIRKGTPEFKAFEDTKKNLFTEHKDIEFTVFFNSRNIRRKSATDLILAYRTFCDIIGEEKAKKCAMIMHTELVSNAGTDLMAVRDALCDPSYVNISFSTARLSTQQLNFLYNAADVTVLPSANEGWGLSLTESMMAGTMIIANVTGGMQDQMRFVDDKGEWYTPSSDIPSNHTGKFIQHGEWAVPVFPVARTLIGSPLTPYIFEDHVKFEDLANAILTVYNLPKEERDRRGMKGHEWVMSDESMMSAENMGVNVIKSINQAFENFKPRTAFDIIKVQDKPKRLVKHKLTNF